MKERKLPLFLAMFADCLFSCFRILEKCRNLTELNLGWTELGQDTVARVCGLLGPMLSQLHYIYQTNPSADVI